MQVQGYGVNDVFRTMVRTIHNASIEQKISNVEHGAWREPPLLIRNSRNGKVIQVVEPVTVTYLTPQSRVLLNTKRDANPFFHVFEALWMLSGSKEVTPLSYYVGRMLSFSDDGQTLNGAYGYRWRNAEVKRSQQEFSVRQRIDQLNLLVQHLRADNDSRRAVLQMWNVEDDLLRIGTACEVDVLDASADVCCNLCCVFQVRSDASTKWLDMTVFNRSNDMIWGMLGANLVHFSFLQEYIAARIGAEVGRMHQVTANLHVYTDNWEPEEWLSVYGDEDSDKEFAYPNLSHDTFIPILGKDEDPELFDQEVSEFIGRNGDSIIDRGPYVSQFLQRVAMPMCNAYKLHKQRDYKEALKTVDMLTPPDWRKAAWEWLKRREAMWDSNKTGAYLT